MAMKTMVSDNRNKDMPRLVKDLLEYDEHKDSMVGLAIQSGVDESLVNLSQSEIDETYEWLKEAEANDETGFPYNILDHYTITFQKEFGWKIDAYHFATAGGQTRLMCKIFRPDGNYYGCLSIPGLLWDRLLQLAGDSINIKRITF